MENLVFISENSNQLHRKSKIFAGDVVVVRTGQAGTAAVVPKELDGANCIDLLIVRRSEQVLSQFVYYYLNSCTAISQAAELSVGAIQAHYNTSTLAQLVVPKIPTDEQSRIVTHLDQATGEIRRPHSQSPPSHRPSQRIPNCLHFGGGHRQDRRPGGSDMSPEISERAFEQAIECALLRHGPDACPGDATGVRESGPAYGDDAAPGGYLRRRPEDYDRGLCLIPGDVVDFLLATQPKEWERLKQHHGSEVKPRFLGRLSREIARRGALDVLRNGIKDMGCRFRMAYFRPASGLNEELQRLHAANLFAEVRQLRYSEQGEHSLDLAIFLNGIPIFTAPS